MTHLHHGCQPDTIAHNLRSLAEVSLASGADLFQLLRKLPFGNRGDSQCHDFF